MNENYRQVENYAACVNLNSASSRLASRHVLTKLSRFHTEIASFKGYYKTSASSSRCALVLLMFKRSGEEIFITSKEALYSHLMGYLKTVKFEDNCLEEAMNCLEFGSVKDSLLVPLVCDGNLGFQR